MDKTALGNRMKAYEMAEDRKIMPRIPIMIRLDGKCFSSFCKNFDRPFDDEFRRAMVNTTKFLVSQFNPKIAYTQSDEISLIIYEENYKSNILFDSRVQKICSTFAQQASTYFLSQVYQRWPEKVGSFFETLDWSDQLQGKSLPGFDCRVYGVPDKVEAYNALLWREQDCTKNSIAMVAQSKFSQKDLMKKNGNEQQAMLLKEFDINWNNFTSAEKRGTYVRKEKVLRKLSQEKLDMIPAGKVPENGMVERSQMVEMDMPPIMKVENIIDVIFAGAQPNKRS